MWLIIFLLGRATLEVWSVSGTISQQYYFIGSEVFSHQEAHNAWLFLFVFSIFVNVSIHEWSLPRSTISLWLTVYNFFIYCLEYCCKAKYFLSYRKGRKNAWLFPFSSFQMMSFSPTSFQRRSVGLFSTPSWTYRFEHISCLFIFIAIDWCSK